MPSAPDPAPTPPKPRKHWLPRLRFSLRTLVLAVLLIGSAAALWLNWAPWTVGRRVPGDRAAVLSSAIAPDGRRLMTLTKPPKVDEPGTIALCRAFDRYPAIASIWDLENPNAQPTVIAWGSIMEPDWQGWHSYEFTSDSRWVVARFREYNFSRARIFDAATGRDLFAPGDEVLDVCIPRDDGLLFAVYQDKPAEVWDLNQRKVLKTLPISSAIDVLNGGRWSKDLCIGERPDGFCARFSPDARWITLGERTRLAAPLEADEDHSSSVRPYVQNTETGEKFPFEGELPIFDSFSPDSRTLMTQSQYECCLYDLSSQTLLHRIDGIPISSPFTPDGKKFMVFCKQDWPREPTLNGEFRLYDIKTGEQGITIPGIETFPAGSSGVTWTGTRVTVARSLFTEGESHIVDSETGNCMHFHGVVNSSPDGERIVTFDLNEKRAEMRDSRKHELLFQLPSDTRIWSAAWVRDGATVVLGGEDGTAVLWRRRRPESWWGIAWLPEFWLTALLAGALGWSVWRDRAQSMRKLA